MIKNKTSSLGYFIEELSKNPKIHSNKTKKYKILKKKIINEINNYYKNYKSSKLLEIIRDFAIDFPF